MRLWARPAIESPAMNTSLLLDKARKEVECAKKQATVDEKAARLAQQLARAAKGRLKHARKLSKMVKKSARMAENKSEESVQALERAEAKLEKLQKRLGREQRKNKHARIVRRSKRVQKASRKPEPARSHSGLPRNRSKSKPSRTTAIATPRLSPVQPPEITEPTGSRAQGARGAAPKAVNAKPAPTVAPGPKPVPARNHLTQVLACAALDVDAPSSSVEDPAND